jgi:hypothetical protein
MELTGIFWIVPYEVLEEVGLEIQRVNARFFKSCPRSQNEN